jgi:uncharacterized protein (DUF58 family)
MKRARPILGLPLPQSQRFERFLKRRYVRSSERRLTRERIFILPTYYGLTYGVAVFVMLMGSLNYNNSLAFMLTFLLGGMGLLATFHTYKNIHLLALDPAKAAPVFAGQPARFTVTLENRDGPARFAVSIKTDAQAPMLVDVPANGQTSVELVVPTRQRGHAELGIITVETRFPLGIYHAWSYVRSDVRCLVYPKPAGAAQAGRPSHDARGDVSQQLRHGSEDFSGLRSYHSGDSTRHIDWKALARQRGLLTKQFSLPAGAEIWLDWNDAPGADVEEKLSQLCRWVLDAEEMQNRYGLRLPGTIIPPAVGAAHKHGCLEALALFSAT